MTTTDSAGSPRSRRSSKLCYVVTAKKIDPALAAHIHAGDDETAGPIVVALRAPTRGLAADCIRTVPEGENSAETLTDAELAAIRANPDQFYVNVHNAPFPAGAIRGRPARKASARTAGRFGVGCRPAWFAVTRAAFGGSACPLGGAVPPKARVGAAGLGRCHAPARAPASSTASRPGAEARAM